MAVAVTLLAPPDSSVETATSCAAWWDHWATDTPDPAWQRALADRLRDEAPVYPTLAKTRRHRGWHDHRKRVWTALLASHAAPTRLRRFHGCGQGAFVQRHIDDPGRYRVVLETCRDRWCAPCAAERRSLIVGHLQEHMRRGVHRLITLGLKSTDLRLRDQLSRLTLCFRRLRQRVLWRERVDGGLAGFEVTYNQETRQWHPHLHAIVHGRWIGQADLSAAWRDVTGDSYVVDIRMIRHADKVAGYVAKYATKPLPASLQRDPERLLEAVDAFVGRRTFIQFGDWSKHSFTRRPDTGDWETLGFLAEVIRDDSQPSGLAHLINAAFDSIADGLAMREFEFRPPP